MDKIQQVQLPAASRVREEGAARRELEAQGVKTVDRPSLQAQCSELNRQAVVPPPDSAAGKSFGEILDSIKP